ncbi:5-(carboxyamino)imidazole ribonucleotide mutase [Deltaproteobacteria bacterium PRO3]|nr:5-(carboxyamino)imidazole ribonucleotide mutase [Deltaproteobacteria bacterium PRO3]
MTTSKSPYLVSILMGSDSDLDTMRACQDTLKEFGVTSDIKVLSAHRTPDALAAYLQEAEGQGVKVFVAAAGMAAHLAGAVSSRTVKPVIGVPLDASSLGGLDALLSTVQMPAGIPVATVAIGKAGAKNAGFLAVQILALGDPELAKKLSEQRRKNAEALLAKNEKLG